MSKIKKIPVHTKCGGTNIHATQTVYEMSRAVVIETGDKLITVPGDETIEDNVQNIEQDYILFCDNCGIDIAQDDIEIQEVEEPDLDDVAKILDGLEQAEEYINGLVGFRGCEERDGDHSGLYVAVKDALELFKEQVKKIEAYESGVFLIIEEDVLSYAEDTMECSVEQLSHIKQNMGEIENRINEGLGMSQWDVIEEAINNLLE